MMQLQKEIQRLSPTDTVVWFNPWRYEKQDELWASFALTLTRTLRHKARFSRRISGDIKLFFKRINGFVGWAKFITFVMLWIFVAAGASGVLKWAVTKTPAQQQAIVASILPDTTQSDHKDTRNSGTSESPITTSNAVKTTTGGGSSTPGESQIPHTSLYAYLLALGTRGGAVAILLALLSLGGTAFRDRLFDFRLERFLDRPDYKGHTAFLDNFHDDFSKAVSAYSSSSDSKIYVFVDDLDRCEVPKAAELIQAINLMIGDGEQLIFILAIDRQKVAAGIAQKFNDLVPFLTEFQEEDGSISLRSRLNFGYSFLEKFIQLSVRVPIQDNSDDIKYFLQSLTALPVGASSVNTAPDKIEDIREPKSPVGSPTDDAIDYNRIETRGESERIQRVVLMVRHVFRSNPRRLKLFLNSFRLSVYLASSQGLLDIYRADKRAVSTPEQLGKFIALTMRFPELIDILSKNRQALAEYEATAVAADAKKTSNLPSWLDKEGVSDLLRYGVVSAVGEPADEQRYSLRTFPVEKMLSAVPLAPVKPTDSSKPTTPSASTIPLTPELRAGYQDLLAQIQTAIETTTDPGVLEALNSSRTNVDNVLTKDVMYRIEANTALYDALLLRINSTNDELKTLQAQILAISSGISTFGDILGAINKVLTLIPGA